MSLNKIFNLCEEDLLVLMVILVIFIITNNHKKINNVNSFHDGVSTSLRNVDYQFSKIE
jgi:hypothetical protein